MVIKPELTVSGAKASEDVLGFAGKRGTHHHEGVLDLGQNWTAQVEQLTVVLT